MFTPRTVPLKSSPPRHSAAPISLKAAHASTAPEQSEQRFHFHDGGISRTIAAGRPHANLASVQFPSQFGNRYVVVHNFKRIKAQRVEKHHHTARAVQLRRRLRQSAHRAHRFQERLVKPAAIVTKLSSMYGQHRLKCVMLNAHFAYAPAAIYSESQDGLAVPASICRDATAGGCVEPALAKSLFQKREVIAHGLSAESRRGSAQNAHAQSAEH